MKQYCVYCASCVEVDGCLYCDKHEKDLRETQSKSENHCRDFYLSPMGHVRTGRPYRPQKWRYLRAYSNLKSTDNQPVRDTSLQR